MSKKRVHEIAKEQGLSSKELLERLHAAGVEATAAASSVEEAVALEALGTGGSTAPASPNGGTATPRAKSPVPADPADPAGSPAGAGEGPGGAPVDGATISPVAPGPGPDGSGGGPPQSTGPAPATAERVRPTRDSRTGERTPGDIGPGGRRRVVIDSQASRRQQGGPANQPQRRPRRGRRRRGTYDETIAPIDTAAMEATDLIRINSGSTVKDVAEYLGVAVPEVIKKLMTLGEMATLTQTLSDEAIGVLADEFEKQIEIVHAADDVEVEPMFEDAEEDLIDRPPVVTIMGHVDHGKTSLLDAIRETEVVAGEAGGITQHIGAYQVEWQDHPITFIDTPGHEAFTAMRARGAEVTDIVVLVVAADDGVMPQTVEAIAHANAADVPIIVAVNKIDRDEADPNRVLQQLSEHGLVPESWGGDTITVEVSALQSLGIEDLLEQIVLVAEIEELQASPEGRARGVVIEAELEIGRGPVASVIVERGTLRVGDPVVAGAAWGKVKALVDDHGHQIKEAPPSTPVQVLGFSEPPEAGDEFRVAPELAQARTIGEARAHRYRVAGHVPAATSALGGAKLEDLFEQIQRGETATLNLILKADVRGSLEAVTESLRKLERDDVKLSFVHRGVGGITESDVELAQASNATIIGFNVRPDRRSREMAAKADVEIRTYEIIYKLLEDLEAAMLGLLSPVFEEVVTGEAEVRQVFRVPKIGAIAGCYVREGVITRGSKVRFLREGVIIWKGAITSLRRFKDDAREVQAGFECGIGLSDYQDLKEGDIIETFDEREIPRV